MQPDPYGQPQPVMIDPTTGMPSNVVIIKEKSSAPVVVGVIMAILGGLSFILNALSVDSFFDYGALVGLMNMIGLFMTIAIAVGGVLTAQYKKIGVHVMLIAILISAVTGSITLTATEDAIEDEYAAGQMTEEEYEFAKENTALISGLGVIFVLVCNGICGLIAAIPLMMSSDELEGPGLFGGGTQTYIQQL